MIDHDAARRAGATAIDFELDPDERAGLDGHLGTCAACRAFMAGLATDATRLRSLDLGPVPVAVRADVAIAAERHGRRGPSTPVLLAAAAILILALAGGAAIGVGSGRPGIASGPDPAAAVGRAVHWTTDVVDFAADDLWIEVGGQVVVPPDDREIKISSDAGTPQKWTLEVAWNAGRTEMRMNLYFHADATGWRVDEARIYDGHDPGDWLETQDVPIGAPTSAVFAGDIDLTLADRSGPDTGPGRLVMRGLRLATHPGGGLAPIPPGQKPPLIDKDPVPAPPVKIGCGPLDSAACAVVVKDAVTSAASSNPGRTVVSITVDPDGLGWTVLLDDGSAVTMVQ